MLSMDLSASMLSKDFDPNRLEASKTTDDFVNDRPNDRIGVVAYKRASRNPDHRPVGDERQWRTSNGLARRRHRHRDGLATAVNRLKDSEAESKVVILLTDGVNNAGKIEPLDAAQLAKLNDIRVYTIGVGTIGKARSPVAKMGNQFQCDCEVEIDETVLRDIAKLTGLYFRATNGRSWRAFTPKSTNWRKPGSTCFATTRNRGIPALWHRRRFGLFHGIPLVNSPSAP